MKFNWHRQHRWSGIAACFFLLVLSISGIILNHRAVFEKVNVARWLMPPFYACERWNSGLMRGSISVGADSVLVFGDGGIWLAARTGKLFSDFDDGLPGAASERNVRAVVRRGATVYALTDKALYRRDGSWKELFRGADERLSDMTMRGDSLIVVGRSHLFLTTDGTNFSTMTLKKPSGRDISSTTAFRFVWMLHSGELFGLTGRLLVDAVGLVVVLLSVTGIIIWLLPKSRRKRPSAIRANVRLHRKAGVWTVLFVAVVFTTGWFLRPPLMVPLVKWHIPEVGRAAHDSGVNPWSDKLRMLRFDENEGDWLLSTSAGFFRLRALDAVPASIDDVPPVSVMGLNVWQREGDDWICGSFTGIYRWNRAAGSVTDYYTGEPAPREAGPPVGSNRVAGYSADFGDPFVVLHDRGTDRIVQPERLSRLPMSLWTVALEAHSGRIYFGPSATYFFIFIVGAIALWCLLSGWMIRRRKSAK